MNALFRCRLPRAVRGLRLIPLLAVLLLFLWPGQRVLATDIISTYYLNITNLSAFPQGLNYASVTVDVSATDQVKITAQLLNLGQPGYLPVGEGIQEFGLNWTHASTNPLAPTNLPTGWSFSSGKNMSGFGTYTYVVDTSGAPSRLDPLGFDLSTSGLTQLQVAQGFQLEDSGNVNANDPGFFAMHFAPEQGSGAAYTGFLGGNNPQLNPEPGSLLLLSSCLAGLGVAGAWKRWRKAAPVLS